MMYETEDLIAAILPKLVRITGAGDNVSAGCPFPDHEDRNASFSFNKKTGLGKCHGSCGWKGNAYQLAASPSGSPTTLATAAGTTSAGMRASRASTTVRATAHITPGCPGTSCGNGATPQPASPTSWKATAML